MHLNLLSDSISHLAVEYCKFNMKSSLSFHWFDIFHGSIAAARCIMRHNDAITEKKSEIIGICFLQIIEISQENSNTIAIYFLRCEVIDSEEKNHYYNAIYSCMFLYFGFFPNEKNLFPFSFENDIET